MSSHKIDKSINCFRVFELTIISIGRLFALLSLFIVAALLFQSGKFFILVHIKEFFLSMTWNPMSHGERSFGVWPLLYGTFLITFIAIMIATPISIMSAIYITEIADKKARHIFTAFIEVVAGIPTIIYGYFAVISIAPFIKQFSIHFDIENSLENAITAGIAMGIMMTPFICSMCVQTLTETPKHLRQGAIALGSSLYETTRFVILPSMKHSLISIILLAISRAVGETMIVTMASGVTPNITFNIFESVSTITTQIVTLLSGDQEFNSPETLAVFALAMCLFILTLIINTLAANIKRVE
ncbi:MAG: phosphate ABC transporter permease subunit PstC [Rickettsiales bacterium]